MGAVSVFTDRNLSLPTSEQLLIVRIVLEPFFLLGWSRSHCFLLRMESEQLLLARMVFIAVVSCLDGVRSSWFLLGWCASVVCFCTSFSQLCWFHDAII